MHKSARRMVSSRDWKRRNLIAWTSHAECLSFIRSTWLFLMEQKPVSIRLGAGAPTSIKTTECWAYYIARNTRKGFFLEVSLQLHNNTKTFVSRRPAFVLTSILTRRVTTWLPNQQRRRPGRDRTMPYCQPRSY